MQSKPLPYLPPLLAIASLFILGGFLFVASQKLHKEIPLSNERELKVTIEAGFGNLSITRGKSSLVLDSEIDTERGSDVEEFISYSIRDRVGYLQLNTNAEAKRKKRSVNFKGFDSDRWDIRLTDAVPISFDLELGLGKGNLDLTGLKVKDLRLSTGASSVELRFDEPNTQLIENLTIETGLSKFHGYGLCNANFNRLRFEGGVGTYRLDFSGELKREVDVDIEVGLGSVTLLIPEEIGARILYEKHLLAHLDLGRGFTETDEDTYLSANYRTASGRMNIHIEAGLGKVTVRRR